MKAKDKKRLLEEMEEMEKIPHGETLIIVKEMDGSYTYKGETISENEFIEYQKWNKIVLMKLVEEDN